MILPENRSRPRITSEGRLFRDRALFRHRLAGAAELLGKIPEKRPRRRALTPEPDGGIPVVTARGRENAMDMVDDPLPARAAKRRSPARERAA
jgi:hypothetical protein